MDLKTKAAVAVLLAKTFLFEPYEKAGIQWVPPSWLLNVASVIAILIVASLFLPNRKPPTQ